MASQPKPYITVEEYLLQEETGFERHEYLDGEVFAMAGGSPAHALIIANLFSELRPRLKNSGCRVRASDMRIRTSASGLYSYSDAVISCQPESFDGDTLLNPVVIVEVLSKTSEDYDRGKKFERYRQIPSFREFLVVAQSRVYVEHHKRENSSVGSVWTMREFTSCNDVISLDAVNVLLPASAIYDEVVFE